jgi:RimJ/RimL family protein N-acetyltransferase
MIQPIRLDIPSEITSERLLLRVPRPGDGVVLIDAVRDSLPELKPWMPWAKDDYSVADAEDWCRRAAAKRILGEDANYFILHRQTGRFMGNITSFSKDWRVPKFEIGYWLSTREVGHGYMTEALRAVTQMTFDVFGARRIEVHTDSTNHRSRRVAERAGYELEGILKNNNRDPADRVYDNCMYARIR